MSSLLTPVQYEESLGELNQVRPLKLADEVKIEINIPVFNFNPVNKGKPVIGKLLRCDNNGALLKENSLVETNTESKSGSVSIGSDMYTVQFSQPVHYWRLYGITSTFGTDMWITNLFGTVIVQTLGVSGIYLIPFYGDTFDVKGAGIGGWFISFLCKGYY